MAKYIIFFVGIVFYSFSSYAYNVGKDHEALSLVHETTIEKNGVSTKVIEEVYKVLTEKGRSELSLYKYQIDASSEKFQFIEGQVKSEGKTIPVDGKNIQQDKVQALPFGISSVTQVTVPVNHLAIGSVLRLKFKVVSQPSIGNIFSTSQGVTTMQLGKTEIYRFISEEPLKYNIIGLDDFLEAVESNNNGKNVVEFKPTKKAYNLEGVNVKNGLFNITTSSGWKAVNMAAAPKYQAAAAEALPVPLVKIVEEAKKLSSKKEMIDFISREINKRVSYSGNWTTIHGKMFPAGLQKTMDMGKGDCKDYSVALVATLRQLGFEAHPFLTFRSQVYIGPKKMAQAMSTPSPSVFNHVIVWAKDTDGKEWWIDPTNPLVIADVITSDILGNFGLLLDGKSEMATLIPDRNPMPADSVIEQTITLAADNSIRASGLMKMTPSTYNSIAQAERMYGKEFLARSLYAVLNPASTAQMELKKVEGSPTDYSYHFLAHDWVEEKAGKYKGIKLYSPIASMLARIGRKSDSDLGEPGTFTYITKIQSQREIDTVRASCLLRSEWIDFDRYVENDADGVTITDVVKTKKRHIAEAESTGDTFDSFARDFFNCALQQNTIVLQMDESLKTAEDKENDKIKGVSLEVMTDDDAKTLLNVGGPMAVDYRHLKVYQYFQKKLKEGENKERSLVGMAKAIVELGYISNDDYIPAYVKAALENLEQAVNAKDDNVAAEVHYLRVKNFLRLKDIKNANIAYNELKKKDSKSFNFYYVTYLIALKQKNIQLAERWLRASERVAKTEAEKYNFHNYMATFLQDQRRGSEAIKYREFLAKSEPTNAWGWHNLALCYYDTSDWDMVIEYEKKALALAEFGAAKLTISNAYYRKAMSVRSLPAHGNREPASDNKYEEFLLEALKYNDKNVNIFLSLAGFYSFGSASDKVRLHKGYVYAKRAVELEPNNTAAIATLRRLKHMSGVN